MTKIPCVSLDYYNKHVIRRIIEKYGLSPMDAARAFLLSDAHAMLEAVSLRTIGEVSGSSRDRARYRTAGGVLGTTFLVSQRLSQQTFEAMECRGYDGVYKEYNKHKAGWQDAAYVLLIPLLIAAFWYCQRILM